MLNALFDGSTIPLLAKVAAFTERRHEVLAGNIANISTPDYRTRDLPVAEFQAALKQAVERRRLEGGAPGNDWSFAIQDGAAIGDGGLDSAIPEQFMRSIEGPSRTLTFHDGNNRSIEQEVLEMTRNSTLQNVAIELMIAQMNRLQAAISERA